MVGGETRAFGGKAPSPEPPVTALVHEPRAFRRVLSQANLGLGEAYLDGDFEITEGSLGDFLTILLRNGLDRHIRTDLSLTWAGKPWHDASSLGAS